MEAPAVVVKINNEFHGRDGGVEHLWVLEVLVPNFINGIADEFRHSSFRSFKGGKVAEAVLLLRFHPVAGDCRGVSWDGWVVGRWHSGHRKASSQALNYWPRNEAKEAVAAFFVI